MRISRRGFLESTTLGGLSTYAALGAQVDKKTGMPTRVLGRTGARVSIMAMGCGSRWLMYDEAAGEQAFLKALSMGVTYFDSAANYGKGESETRLGKLLKGRRKGLWIVTKIQERDADAVKRTIEASLKNLQLDQVDLIHAHALGNAEDLAKMEAKGNLIDILYKMREQKVARFIGVTCHADPQVLKTALERHDFDCTQMALNLAVSGQGGSSIKPLGENSFERLALPVAVKKKMGVTAMKVFAQDKLLGKAPVETIIRYSLSLPVTATVIGMPKFEHIEQNINIAKNFTPMTEKERLEISSRLSAECRPEIDRFFADHVDA